MSVRDGPGMAAVVRHHLALTAALALAGAALAGPAVAESGATAVDVDARRITVALNYEPAQLDATRSNDSPSINILGHTGEGLTRTDDGEARPGVAERWEIRPDGATFHLRHDARWHDGTPVVAQQFVDSWRRLVDPATASPQATLLRGVANAIAITEGTVPPDALGVEAIGDHRLEVRFERPFITFANRVSAVALHPVRLDVIEHFGDRYASTAETMAANGPFMVTERRPGARVVLQRNPEYWNAERVRLETIDFAYITSDTTAHLNLFRDGRIAYVQFDAESVETALAERWRIHRFDRGGLGMLMLNLGEDSVMRDPGLREALDLAFDRHEFVNRVLQEAGMLPAQTIYPRWMRAGDERLRDVIPPGPKPFDSERARRLVDESLERLGIEPPLRLHVLLPDNSTAARTAEYLQRLWGDRLGIDVRVDRQIFKQVLAKMYAGEFDVVAGLSFNVTEPLMIADFFASWSGHQPMNYRSPAFDDAYRRAEHAATVDAWVEALGDMQRIVAEDRPALVTHETAELYAVHPQLRGVTRSRGGANVDFTDAWIEAR
ncbi:MAG TPA: peptide ABC transporter substrate-binding protein [Pseudomonadales bacterium]|nr:peptide ABC transporter substrate-binding protein [Pseudomonadales bacterium]